MAIYDFREISRFIIAGLTATLANVGVVWFAGHVLSYAWALTLGIVAGCTVSFLASKLFAFRSRAWRGASSEVMRFLLVYGLGVVLYWCVSMVVGLAILPRLMPIQWAKMGGSLVGAGSMLFTSYFGHRFYTYKRTNSDG